MSDLVPEGSQSQFVCSSTSTFLSNESAYYVASTFDWYALDIFLIVDDGAVLTMETGAA
jgi:hypothetical protein